MELKLIQGSKLTACIDILIEPLWNWNRFKKMMPHILNDINRTSMELKRSNYLTSISSAEILIEPLWNWNMLMTTSCMMLSMNINRTSMELKPYLYRIFSIAKWNINRTSMELKLKSWNKERHPSHYINRTSMELKHRWAPDNENATSILIEPLWNWNFANADVTLTPNAILIEPLWNWNRTCSLLFNLKLPHINRTSMELKPGHEQLGAECCD